MTWLRDDLTLFVYALLDREGLAVYVGITVNPPQRRRVHMITATQAYRGDTPLRRWLLERKRTGEPLSMLLLERVPGVRCALVREKYWMDLYRRLGCDLLNTAGRPIQETLW